MSRSDRKFHSSSRARRKDKAEGEGGRKRGDTRQNLLDAAMAVMAADKSGLAGLSLRAVAKEAGVSPTAFYRHFSDMEELGMAMLDEIGDMLRRMLREVRKVGDPQQMISGSLKTFFTFVKENREKFLVLSRERAGGSARMRAAIRNQMSYFSTELASDIQLMGAFPQMNRDEHYLLANMIIQMAVNAVPDVLDLPANHPEAEQEMASDMTKQALMLFLGAAQWNAGNVKKASEDFVDRKDKKSK